MPRRRIDSHSQTQHTRLLPFESATPETRYVEPPQHAASAGAMLRAARGVRCIRDSSEIVPCLAAALTRIARHNTHGCFPSRAQRLRQDTSSRPSTLPVPAPCCERLVVSVASAIVPKLFHASPPH